VRVRSEAEKSRSPLFKVDTQKMVPKIKMIENSGAWGKEGGEGGRKKEGGRGMDDY
jgi:hypothetical protein